MSTDPDDAPRRLLVEDLRALADAVPAPPPAAAAAMADAVLARLAAAPPAPRRSAWHERARVGERLRMRRRLVTVAAGVVAVLGALLAAPPVRAAVADWFGFGGVRVRITPTPAPTTAPPPRPSPRPRPSRRPRPRSGSHRSCPPSSGRRTACRCRPIAAWCR